MCPRYYIGKTCEKNNSKWDHLWDADDKCRINPCQNGGICSSSVSSNLSCLCSNKFTGKYCESLVPKKVDLCTKNSCLNRGICITHQIGNNNYKNFCICSQDFTGAQCQTSINSTIISFYKNNCNKNGILLNGSCKCFESFYGK